MRTIPKIISNFIYFLLIILGLIYISTIIILFYIGPLETIIVKKKLKTNPVNIIVSLTVRLDEIDKLQSTLNSIARQSIGPNKIYLNIPQTFKFNNNNKLVIPDWLTSKPNIIINMTKDYGPLTKLIPTLKQEQDPNTVIINIDNNIYPKHTIRDLVKQYLPGTYEINDKLGAAITGVGFNILFGPHWELNQKEILIGNRPSINIVSSSGVAYKRKFFAEDFFSFTNQLPPSCIQNDDLIISAYLFANNINIIKISDISYNKIIYNVLNKNDLMMNYQVNYNNNYSKCLASLSTKNNIKYPNAILKKSQTIYQTFHQSQEIWKIYFNKLYYAYLIKIVRHVPYLQKIIITVMQ